MSNPASELDRPTTQAWGGHPGGVGVGGQGAGAGDSYDYDHNDAIQKKGCWYNFSTGISRELTPFWRILKEFMIQSYIIQNLYQNLVEFVIITFEGNIGNVDISL